MALFFPVTVFVLPIFMVGLEAINWTQQSLKGQYICRDFLRRNFLSLSKQETVQLSLTKELEAEGGQATLQKVEKDLFEIEWQLPVNELSATTGSCRIDFQRRTLL